MQLTSKKSNHGSLMLIVVISTFFLSIVGLSYLRSASHQKGLDQYFLRRLLVNNLADTVLRESKSRVISQSSQLNSKVYSFIINQKPGQHLQISTPTTKAALKDLLPEGYTAEIKSKITIDSFSNYAPNGQPYSFSIEGHGIISFYSKVTLTSSQLQGSATTKKSYSSDYFVSTLIPENLISNYDLSILNQPFAIRSPDLTLSSNPNTASIRNIKIVGGQTSLQEQFPVTLSTESLYSKYALYRSRNMTLKDLERKKIFDLDNNRININGIIQVSDNLVINNDFKIHGRGAIIADGFVINKGLQKNTPEDFLILFSRKNDILINTKKSIECGIIALSNDRKTAIKLSERLDLKGFLLTDNLKESDESFLNHIITWDSVFSEFQNTVCINISKWKNRIIIE